ncbi:hypothetical protein DSH57_12920 [Enterococcus faecium]|nr:transposase [Enterococcus faecium]EGP5344049.1 hypothetical protein [Enterococcus faecium]EGP5672465.1 hypothetical protein [Enterococcus faecium]EGP5699538.1 hypothetical protein [Enterococcus faecium]
MILFAQIAKQACPTHNLLQLTSYFLAFTNPKKVEFLATYMNISYFQLINRFLPNAKVVSDRLLSFYMPLKKKYLFFYELVEDFRDKGHDLFFY